mgnify:CR=1 FL=1
MLWQHSLKNHKTLIQSIFQNLESGGMYDCQS